MKKIVDRNKTDQMRADTEPLINCIKPSKAQTGINKNIKSIQN